MPGEAGLRTIAPAATRALEPADAAACIELMVGSDSGAPPTYPSPPPDPGLGERRVALVEAMLRAGLAHGSAAELDGRLAGFSLRSRRGDLWGLAMLFVRADLQGAGIGSLLCGEMRGEVEAARRGLITSSADPRAMRVYAGLGFELVPAMGFAGRVDPAHLRPPREVREGGLADLPLIDAVDRELRGASRAPDVELLVAFGASILVLDDGERRGFAVHLDGRPLIDGSPLLLGASSVEVARELMWAFLDVVAGREIRVYFLTHAQSWAFQVAFEARLSPFHMSPTFVRGYDRVPGPWVPSGVFF